MKILVLGAGGVGGYFGARLIEIGVDVTFFVRKKKAEIIKIQGLKIESPHGNLNVHAKTLSIGDKKQNFDLVLLTCKAYDLKSSLDDLGSVLINSPILLPLFDFLTIL